MFRKQPSWLAGALIEIVVVVVSILIAFSLDAWWDRQMERRQEGELLAGLLSEFKEVEAQIEEERRFHEAVKETTLLLMELSLSDDRPVQADSLDRLLGDLFWWGGESNYSSGTLTSVIASGQISIIQNDRLRDLLAEWPRVIGDIRENEANEIWEYRNGLKPFMRTRANMARLANQIEYEPGSEEPYPVTKVPESSSKTDHWALVKDPQFHNLMLFRLWTNDDILTEFNEFHPHLEEILTLLGDALQG